MTEQSPLMDRITALKDPIETLWAAANAAWAIGHSTEMSGECEPGLKWVTREIDSAVCRLEDRYKELYQAAGGEAGS